MKDNSTPPQEIYDDFYFKHACGGHEEFTSTKGEKLSPWMTYALFLADLKPGEKVLDLGTGRGEIAYHAAKKGCFSIGLDYAMAAMGLAKDLREKAKNQKKPFELILSDARYFPFNPNQFNVILMLDIVEHLSPDDLLRVLKQVYSHLKPGGRLIIHTMPNLNYYRWGYPIYRGLLKIFGKNLPKDPRDRFYHGEVHVNIQTPKSLYSYLHNSGFDDITVNLTQLSGSKIKIFLCRLFPLKFILANDIIAIAKKKV